MYQSNPVGIHFRWVYVTDHYILHTEIWASEVRLRMFSFDSAESSVELVGEKRARSTQPNHSVMFVRKVVHIS